MRNSRGSTSRSKWETLPTGNRSFLTRVSPGWRKPEVTSQGLAIDLRNRQWGMCVLLRGLREFFGAAFLRRDGGVNAPIQSRHYLGTLYSPAFHSCTPCVHRSFLVTPTSPARPGSCGSFVPQQRIPWRKLAACSQDSSPQSFSSMRPSRHAISSSLTFSDPSTPSPTACQFVKWDFS